jgi:hypothetical protein
MLLPIFYDHLGYCVAIWYNLWQFGKVCGHLVNFFHFGMFGPKKSGNPGWKGLFTQAFFHQEPSASSFVP